MRWADEKLPTLHRLAHRYNRGPDDTSSIVNSFLVKLFLRSTAAIRGIKNRTGYAVQSFRFAVLARFRRRAKQPSSDSVAVETAVGPDRNPDNQVEEQRALFARAWSELSPDERELIDALEIQGRTAVDVGVSLGIEAEAVRKRKQSVMERLETGIALLAAAAENRWHPGSLHDRLLVARFFRRLSQESVETEFGWTRQQVKTWLERTRSQLPPELREAL
jgi:RNA polymerase sigma factor (sigma-70 family)